MTEAVLTPDEDLLPYDDALAYPKFWDRILRTFRAFMANPRSAAERIANTHSQKDGLSFLLAFAWPIQAVSEGLKVAAVHSPWLRIHVFAGTDLKDTSLVSSILAVVFMPIGAWIGFWIGALVLHGSLWIWRGFQSGLGVHQTARAFGFGFGLNCVISVLVSLIAVLFARGGYLPHLAIASLVVMTAMNGYLLAKTHGTGVWRGIAACATPSLVLMFLGSGFSFTTMGKAFLQ